MTLHFFSSLRIRQSVAGADDSTVKCQSLLTKKKVVEAESFTGEVFEGTWRWLGGVGAKSRSVLDWVEGEGEMWRTATLAVEQEDLSRKLLHVGGFSQNER